MRKTTLALILIFTSVFTLRGAAPGPDYDESVSSLSLLNLDVHLLVGGSYITENYRSCYPQISDINTVTGPAWGLGVGARFNIRPFLGLGTELNFTRNSDKMDLAVVGTDNTSVSNVFQRNTYWKLDFPVYLTYISKLANSVSWNVDAGIYYSYGTGGSQKNNIYHTSSNDLGQLMMVVTSLNTGFYNDYNAFIISYRRGDLGLHLATGLTFANHLKLGLRTHIGCQNTARSTGIVRPKSHNIDFLAMLGWQF